MHPLIQRALDVATTGGATYADARLIETRSRAADPDLGMPSVVPAMKVTGFNFTAMAK